jgi:hypothetical protein
MTEQVDFQAALWNRIQQIFGSNPSRNIGYIKVFFSRFHSVQENRVLISRLEELHNLYSSPSIIRIIKSRKIRWAGHVARMGEKRNV